MGAEVAVVEHAEYSSRFQQSLAREQRAERELFKSLLMSVLVALPVSISVFLLIAAVAVSGKAEWYVWVGLGVGMGVLGALLMGALAGATMNAHKLDEVDRRISA